MRVGVDVFFQTGYQQFKGGFAVQRGVSQCEQERADAVLIGLDSLKSEVERGINVATHG